MDAIIARTNLAPGFGEKGQTTATGSSSDGESTVKCTCENILAEGIDDLARLVDIHQRGLICLHQEPLPKAGAFVFRPPLGMGPQIKNYRVGRGEGGHLSNRTRGTRVITSLSAGDHDRSEGRPRTGQTG